jgi:phage FluMu gp28-like protein
VLILHWSRQIGKSYVLAAWAVDRLLIRPGRLVTVLSNSRDNGAEFVQKCSQVCVCLGEVLKERNATWESVDDSPNPEYENMRMEVRLCVDGKIGRIKVLAANPRTARGFSGDLILDEFAFHEDSAAIWEAAEPILSSNPDFLCRIASTGNGKHNMFYRMVSGSSREPLSQTLSSTSSNGTDKGDDKVCDEVFKSEGHFYHSAAAFKVSRITRTAAHAMGVKVFDPATRAPVTPAEARAKALDKRAYDQNYECAVADENMTLLTHELISAAERSPITIDDQAWSAVSISRLSRAEGRLEVGNDIGRNRDLSFVTVIERLGSLRRVIAMLRMQGLRGPDQRRQLEIVCAMPRFAMYCGDQTGLGTFFIEELQEKFGLHRIRGVNFATTEPITARIAAEGRKHETARVTEIMATNLLAVFEDRLIEIPADQELRDDLRKPEKITSPGGRVSIAATRDEAGHADGFWSLALAVRAGEWQSRPFEYSTIPRPEGSRPSDRDIGVGRFTKDLDL